ncbi:MAG TPA: hypothetical protein VHM88_11060 [Candidatus Acidoferrales bacterium]|nr:hypothetical protein [Candidatus Acidoferrales bacterium]
MPPSIATIVYAFGILGLFVLDRDPRARTSRALWVPLAWLTIIATRPVSLWLGMAPPLEVPDQYLEGSPLDAAVFAGLLAIGLIVLASRGRQVATLIRANWPILLFFLYCAISTLWSDYPIVAFKRWIKSLGDLMMVLIVLTDPHPLAALKRLLSRLGLALLPLSVLLIKYYPNLGRTYSAAFGEWHSVYIGVTTNKNSLGALVLIFGLGAVWRFLELLQTRDVPHRWRGLIAQGFLLVNAIYLLWQVNSATSSGCFVIGSLLLATVRLLRFARKPGVIHLLVAASVSVPLFALFLDPGSGVFDSLGRDPTLTGRTDIWSLVLNMPVNRLIGAGFESFWLGERLQEMWSLYWWKPHEAHNGYIEVLLNLGWVGVSLLALLLITGYRNIISTLRRTSKTTSLQLAYLLTAVIYSFTESAFRNLSLTWIFLLMAVAGAAEACLPETQPRVTIDPRPKWATRDAEFGRYPWTGPRREFS